MCGGRMKFVSMSRATRSSQGGEKENAHRAFRHAGLDSPLLGGTSILDQVSQNLDLFRGTDANDAQKAKINWMYSNNIYLL